MVGLKTIIALSLLASVSAHADRVVVSQAVEAVGLEVTKLSVLTGNFTPEMMKDPNRAGYEIAVEMTDAFKDSVVDGLNQGASCDQINEKAQGMKMSALLLKGLKPKMTPLLQMRMNKLDQSLKDFVAVQCADLTE